MICADENALQDNELDSDMNASELTTALGKLEERVGRYVKTLISLYGIFFVIFGGIAAKYGTILWDMHGSVVGLQQAQANSISNVVVALLRKSPTTKMEAAQNLLATATLLRNSPIGPTRANSNVLHSVTSEIVKVQNEYPDLPEVWQATAQFINFRSASQLPTSAEQTLVQARGLRCDNIYDTPGRLHFSRCELDLEGLSISGLIAEFTNCVIRYNGGPIPVQHMEFINCIFEFQVNQIPARQATIALTQLTIESGSILHVDLS